MVLNEARLFSLFDFQKFSADPHMSKLIAQTEARMNSPEAYPLADDDVNVWAAGNIDYARGSAPEVYPKRDDD